MVYPDSLSVREAREIYFKNNGFDEKTYTDPWVKLPVRGFRVFLPNIKPRRKAVPFHDIDHVLTEYKTDWLGEWQIGSYELGTGCGKYWAGWMINLQAILAGALRAPIICTRAFARGRRSKGIFHYSSWEPLLNENLGELRKFTTAPANSIKLSFADIFLFYLLFILSATAHLLPLIFTAWLVIINI